jgi:ATP-dependent helicase Lhr and Lhr-like helicase
MSFERLAPFIQEYIYQQNWTELRPIQEKACEIIFDTSAHLLIATATASGKTEAAFLPVLTLLNENPVNSIGVLYISPIKALINNQFKRINELLKQSDLQVWAWHGDINSHHKKKLLKNPQGILQITPESLESLLINYTSEIPFLFKDLQFIIIDEIHGFMGTQRGYQILCQLTRLARYIGKIPRRIGLSATLGDYQQAEKWLALGTNFPVITPKIESFSKTIRLAVEHFYQSENKAENNPYYDYIFELTKDQKCLIFANNRTETEEVIAGLRDIAKKKNLPDIYHVHHGSISSVLREDAEFAMGNDQSAVIAATVTLEMGIDIGQLEKVIQLNSPVSVASFLQRLGRTGRRENPADMRFICTEKELILEDQKDFPKAFPWQLLQCIAIIQLYLEEKWIEPIKELKYPFSLLYHQTMSIIVGKTEITPAQLAQEVLTLPIFSAITQDEYRQLLHYLLAIKHLEMMESGKLIMGIQGEKIVNSFQFYGVFDEQREYIVKNESSEVGKIGICPPLNGVFALAGRNWQVMEIDEKRRSLFVKATEKKGRVYWYGKKGNFIHTKVMEKIKQVLISNQEYSYLQPQGQERLKQGRSLAKKGRLDHHSFISLDDNIFAFFPWLGTASFQTLERIINLYLRQYIDIKKVNIFSPYYFIIQLGDCSLDQFKQELNNFISQDFTTEDLIFEDNLKLNKYDSFIPDNLLKKAFAFDYLTLEEIRNLLI